MRVISRSEIAEHNKEDSLWIIIDDFVYDVTEWQNTHPGGKKMLRKVGGKDATKQFHSYHDVDTVMNKFGVNFRIGKVESSAVEANPASASLVATKMHENWQQTEANRQQALKLLLEMNATAASEPHPLALKPFGNQIPHADPLWYQGYYSPYYTQKHALVRERIRKWVDTNVMPHIEEWDLAGEYPEELYTKFGADGWLPYALVGLKEFPAKYARNKHADIIPTDEFDSFASLVVSEEMNRVGSCAFAWFMSGGFMIGLPPVLHHASEEVKARVIPQVLSGKKRICLCITEPSGGSDVANILTTAEKTEDGKYFIVNGVKKWITNGIYADYFSVAVRTGGDGMNGISMLLLESTMEGITRTKLSTQGVIGSGSTLISFDDVKVPVGNLIGKENQGFKVIMSNFNNERMGVISQAIRFSRACYEDALKWSFQRKTFGQRLFEHGVIRNKFGQMSSRIEAAQAQLDYLTYQNQCMDPLQASIKLGGPVAALKAFATQTFEYVAREATQIFGGLAYTRGGRGGRVERLYREVRSLSIPGGSEEIMLDLAVRQDAKVAIAQGAKL